MIGAALLGCGYWGARLARNLTQSPRFALRWVCDPDGEARARLAPSAERAGPSLDEALQDSSVEAVVIATPPATHADLATAALRAGRHVWVEKPLAHTVEGARRLVEEADAADRVLFVDHTFLYAPAVEKLVALREADVLGRIHLFDSTRVNLGLVQRDVNVAWDLAPHDLSIFQAVVGARVEAVRAVYARGLAGDPRPTAAYVDLACAGDVHAHLTLDWLSPSKVRRTVIRGDRAMAVYDDTQPSERVRLYDCHADVHADRHIEYHVGEVTVPHLSETEPLASAMRHFADCIEHGDRPRTSGSDGLAIVRLLAAIDAAAESPGWLPL